MKTCADVMTKNPICCQPMDTVAKAAMLMKRENVGSLPVIEIQQLSVLTGIVTDRDLVLRVVSEGMDPNRTTVESVMTRPVVTCRPEDDFQKAVDAMAKHQVRRIPIVDENSRILGIIAQADVATRGNEPEKTGVLVKDISESHGQKL
jgi:CBS domain-containing protein